MVNPIIHLYRSVSVDVLNVNVSSTPTQVRMFLVKLPKVS